MKKFRVLTFILAAYILCNLKGIAQFPEPQVPPRLVNDFAGFLNENEREQLENKLVAYNDSTSTQISIVTITDLGPYPASDYAFQLAEKWGIGQKGKNNGILILAAKNQREVFIATGYGLEDVLPDAICKRIVEDIIIPRFREGNFFAGFDEATDEIIARASGKYTADNISRGDEIPLWVILLILVIVLIIISVAASSGGNRGGTISSRGYRGMPGPIFWGGGFGGDSGGFGSRGGFGGFGGGSFGGGGAGGRW
ncbi:MAG: TPM domain-containing protein [Chitinophagales bacterium]|nr:TPM domain-containing protein [Chitinophagales bacterium]MDW8273168.1 TPM domain-containing protein [Chitinophagales bacterium]